MADEQLDLPPLPPSPSPSIHDVPEDEVDNAIPLAVRDARYYLDFVVFSVEDRLYMVPKYKFAQATDFFKSDFESTIDEETPIRLEGVEKVDFEALLKIMYPLNPTYEQPTLSNDEWISVLKLSSQWMMLDIRDIAIAALSELPSHRKVVLAKKYSEYGWLRAGYIDLAKRDKSLSVEDAISLGLDVVLKLVGIREESLQRNREEHRRYNQGRGALDYWRDSPIDIEFSAELDDLHSAQSVGPADRVTLARTYNIAQWLRSAYIELAERKEIVSLDEAEKLGLESTMSLCKARESALRSYPSYLWGVEVRYGELIDAHFGEELRDVRKANARYLRVPKAELNVPVASTAPRGIKKKKKIRT
ncbi:hypothetical protein FPV67DRAFT_1168804 [Lyophyllum atratum]|nr:hypothetical protein FPV67DRAFT_1168804 [Lyophyllum atratum]